MLPVLLGGDANVYGMARSFYECYGVRSLAVCRRALPALAHSRLVRVAVQDPAFVQDHVFTATLLGLAAQYPGVPKILISCADDYTALLARRADALRGAYRFACPPPAALHLADKRQFAAACRAAGLRTPQTVTLCPADALPPLPFGWPVIAKPADQAAYARCDFPGRCKVYLVQDAARLRELLAAAARGRQRLLRGGRQCAVACAGPAPFAGAHARGHRQLRRRAGGAVPAGRGAAGCPARPFAGGGLARLCQF